MVQTRPDGIIYSLNTVMVSDHFKDSGDDKLENLENMLCAILSLINTHARSYGNREKYV